MRDESVRVSTIAATAITAALMPMQSAHSRATFRSRTTTCGPAPAGDHPRKLSSTALRPLLFLAIISSVLPYKLCHTSIEGRMYKSSVLHFYTFYTIRSVIPMHRGLLYAGGLVRVHSLSQGPANGPAG